LCLKVRSLNLSSHQTPDWLGQQGGKALDWAGKQREQVINWGGDALNWAGRQGEELLRPLDDLLTGRNLEMAGVPREAKPNINAPTPSPRPETPTSAPRPGKTAPAKPPVAEETTPTNLPSSRSPDVDTPNGRTPDVETPNGGTPQVDAPNVRTPEVDTPNARTPEVETPNARTPEVDTPNPARVEPEAPAPRNNADGTANIEQGVGEAGLRGADNAAGPGRVVDKPVTASQAVKIGDETHTLSVRQVGGKPAIYLCSDCGPLLSKIDQGLNDPNLSDAVKLQLRGLRKRVQKFDVSLGKGKFSQEAIETELQLFQRELEEISESTLPIANKFPDEALDPKGKIFGQVEVVDGKVTLKDGGKVPSEVDFVITTDNRLIIGSKHTTLSNNADVLAAGQMKINGQGKIKRIDNKSGHFRPTVQESSRVPTLFREMGLDITGSNIQLYRFTIDSDGMVEDITKMIDEYLN
jgi:hypothetical protein